LVGVAVAFEEDAAGLAEVDDGEARDLAGPQGLEVVDGGLDPAFRVLPGAEYVQVLEILDQAAGGLVGGAGEADVVAAVVGEDAGLGVEKAAGIAPLRRDAQGQLDLQQAGGGEPGERVEPVLDQGVFDLGQTAGGDSAQHGRGGVAGAFQGGTVVRFQVRGDDESHPPAPQRQARDPAGGEGEAAAGEITGGAAVEDGGLETGDEEAAHQVVAASAVGELQREVGQVGHWVIGCTGAVGGRCVRLLLPGGGSVLAEPGFEVGDRGEVEQRLTQVFASLQRQVGDALGDLGRQ